MKGREAKMVECFFFFQAEDGIRDLVRSRGLGDVYKRQLWGCRLGRKNTGQRQRSDDGDVPRQQHHDTSRDVPEPVSYTHLTLPTSDLV